MSAARRENVCAVVVTFRCGEGVLATIDSLRSQVDHLTIVDNGNDAATRNVLAQVLDRHAPWCEVMFNARNLGIAAGLNAGVRRSRALGCDWILTMDHDSVPAPDMVARLLGAWDRHSGRDRIALVAPRHFDARTGREAVYPVYGKGLRSRHPVFGPDTEFVQPTEVISSGSLIRARVFDDVGLFDERLFIDSVDVDFCLRLARAGYRILVPRDATMAHELGLATEESLGGIRTTVSNHPGLRRYYIVRNRVHLGIRHGRAFPSYLTATLARTVLEFAGVLLFETNRRAKLGAAFRGAVDGLAGRLGPREPQDPPEDASR